MAYTAGDRRTLMRSCFMSLAKLGMASVDILETLEVIYKNKKLT
jgi:hypothetical protein